MPYLSLTLNGYPVDLPPDAQVALSYRANDLRTLGSREASFSETFTLPLTAQNVAVLGLPHVLDSQTTTPYRYLAAQLSAPGGQVLLDGFGILELSHEGYDLTLTDALGGLFNALGSRTLNELDLRAYDHAFTFAGVRAAEAGDAKAGYCYVLCDDGRLTLRDPARGVLFYELTACVYLDALLRAILLPPLPPVPLPVGYLEPFNPLDGYRLAGTLFAEDRYQRAVLPAAGPCPRVRAGQLASTTAAGRVPVARVFPPPPVAQGGTFTALQFPQTSDAAGLSTDPGGVFFAGVVYRPPAYTCDLTVHVTVRLHARHAPGFTNAGNFVALHLLDTTVATSDANSLVGRYDARRIYQGGLSGIGQDITCDYEVAIPFLQHRLNGPTLALYLFADVGLEVTLLPGSSIRFTPAPRVYAGGPVALEAGLPGLKQSDLLKTLCNLFNVVVQTDPVTKVIRFDLFNELEHRRNEAPDWTAKLDLSQRPRLAYRLGDYAQTNTLRYDDAPKEYGQQLGATPYDNVGGGTLYVRNATLPARAEAYAAPLGLPQPHDALGGISLVWRPLLREGNPDPLVPATRVAIPWLGGVIGYDENSPRLVYGGATWRAKQNVTQNSPAPDARFPQTWEVVPYEVLNDTLPQIALVAPLLPGMPLVHDDAPGAGTFAATQGLSRTGLTFTELLPAYYPTLAGILDRVRVLTVDLRLTPMDILALDFTRPIQLGPLDWPGYGRLDILGYLNGIDQYQPAAPGPVACTFLVLGEPVPGLAPLPGNPPVTLTRAERVLAAEEGEPLLSETAMHFLLEA